MSTGAVLALSPYWYAPRHQLPSPPRFIPPRSGALHAEIAATGDAKNPGAPTAEQIAFFEKSFRPVLASKCYKCHSAEAEKVKGGLLLDTREGIRAGGDSGHAVVPGSLSESLLIAPAIRNLTDRLLASPRFGERWGRHWLDVARFAESTGKERNFTFPDAWRYRDGVIAAVNDDKPYDRFIIEQIAGDLLPARDSAERDRHLIATGFLAVGTKGLNERNRDLFRMPRNAARTTNATIYPNGMAASLPQEIASMCPQVALQIAPLHTAVTSGSRTQSGLSCSRDSSRFASSTIWNASAKFVRARRAFRPGCSRPEIPR